MTSASEYLSVSFYLTDISGASYQPSEIVLQCKKVFKNIVAYDRFDFDAKKESMYALRPAFDAVAEMLGRGEKVPESLLEVFSQITEYSAKMDSLKNARVKFFFFYARSCKEPFSAYYLILPKNIVKYPDARLRHNPPEHKGRRTMQQGRQTFRYPCIIKQGCKGLNERTYFQIRNDMSLLQASRKGIL